MPAVAVAASNQLAADAGGELARLGGSTADAALAAALVSMITEPGIVSLGGGAYITVRDADGSVEVVDGNVEMPGRGLPAERFGHGTFDIETAYGGGVEMTIGHGSVATPGTPAALARVHEHHGRAPWGEVLAPAIDVARRGFPMGAASDYYLEYVHETLFGWHAPSHAAIHHDDGTRIREGETVVIDDLADSLEELAREGVRSLYEGDLGRLVVTDVQAHHGLLTMADLEAYEPERRDPLSIDHAGWEVSTNPPPALGGGILAAMLLLSEESGRGAWTEAGIRRMVAVQDAVLGHRVGTLDVAADRAAAVADLLAAARAGDLSALATSPSTIQVSAAGADGLTVSLTASAGYGSGVMPPGTGFWLNNCLGERELNRRGLHAWDPGTRLPSNMAPTVAAEPAGGALAIGSPGADRITTAILQTLLPFLSGGMDLAAAVARPRLHVRHYPEGGRRVVGYERDLRPEPAELDLAIPVRAYHPHAMFFGGVAAALHHPAGGLEAVADPRRTGGTLVT